MTMRNKGETTVDYHGQPVQAVRVYFAPKNILLEKFYNRTFYFRKSDGLFLKSAPHDGRAMELEREEEMRTVKSGDSAPKTLP